MEATSSSFSSIFSSSSFVVDISELDDPCSPSSSSSSSSVDAAAAAAGNGSVDPSSPCPSPLAFMIICCGSRSKKAADGRGSPRHFLDSCFLCKRSISMNSDVFMYRGDAPFCSMECRQEQMEMDKALEQERRHYCISSSSSSSTTAVATIPTITNYTTDENSTTTGKGNKGKVMSIRKSSTMNLTAAGTAAMVVG
ncbi:uncharacterized protein LOC109712283 [Ananas comosus]|uniref:Uncharacterized protein LOC109712283 n=1 Tax=Ananas comosus TaxID=4615 RepID=A0A6P5F5T0_ANACO|nr:uncharacterized protein LOC109712283 [Ananas comosus]